MATKKLVLLVSLLCLMSAATNPGVQAGLNEQAIENVKEALVPWMTKNAEDVKVPDQEEVIGSGLTAIKVYLTDINVDDLVANMETTEVELEAPDLIMLNLNGMSGHLKFNWKYRYLLGSSDGSGVVDLGGVNGSFLVALTSNNGRPHITVKEAELAIDELKVHLEGSLLAEVADFIIWLFKGSIKDLLVKLITESMKTTLADTINRTFDKMPTYITLPGTDIGVNYTFTENPVIGDTYAQFDIEGAVIDEKKPNYHPDIPPPVQLPPYDPNAKQYQVLLTDYFLNTALNTLYAVGTGFNLSSAFIDSAQTYVKADTSFLNATFFPGIETAFGPGRPCDLVCVVGKQPLIDSTGSTQPNGIVSGSVELDCSVMVHASKYETAIDLAVKNSFNVSLFIDDWVLKGTLKGIGVTSVVESHAASGMVPNPESIKQFLNIVFGLLVGVIDDKVLAQGIPLPNIPQVDMSQTSFTIEKGYYRIGATPIWSSHLIVQ